MVLSLFVLFAAVSAGVMLYQGVLVARGTAAAMNVPASVVVALAAAASLACLCAHYAGGNPAMLARLLRLSDVGLCLAADLLVATVVLGVAAAVVAHRSEDGDLPAWLGVVCVVLALALVFSVTLAYDQSAISKIGRIAGRFFTQLAYVLSATIAAGAFATLATAALAGDGAGVTLARRSALPGVLLIALGMGGCLLWYALSGDAGSLTGTQVNFTTNITIATTDATRSGWAASAAPATLGELIAANAPAFWGGAVAVGLACPAALGLVAWRTGVDARRAQAIAGLAGLVCVAIGVLGFGTIMPSLM